VCLCVCVFLTTCPHYCTDPDVTWRNGRGCPVVVHYWADLQSMHGFRCYDNIGPNAKCQRVLVLILCLVVVVAACCQGLLMVWSQCTILTSSLPPPILCRAPTPWFAVSPLTAVFDIADRSKRCSGIRSTPGCLFLAGPTNWLKSGIQMHCA